MDISSLCIFFHMRCFSLNQDLTELLPHFEYQGLMVTYRYLPSNDTNLSHARPVYNDFLNESHIKPDELKAMAVQSLSSFFTPILYRLSDYARELRGGARARDLYHASGPLKNDIYICTNQYMQYGASFIYSEDVLSHLADILDNSFYILPSSVHELLILPPGPDLSPDHLKEILSYMNQEEMSTVDVLSENIFYYDRKQQALSIVS